MEFSGPRLRCYVDDGARTRSILGLVIADENADLTDRIGARLELERAAVVDVGRNSCSPDNGHGATRASDGACDGDAISGAGVYYGAAVTEAAHYKGKHVVVVGGANSAGQGAMFFSRYASKVTMLVRGSDLEAGRSCRRCRVCHFGAGGLEDRRNAH